MEIIKTHTFVFHTFEKHYSNDFLDQIAEVFQKNAVISKNYFYSKVNICDNEEETITVSANFEFIDIILGEIKLSLELVGTFSLFKAIEKEKRFSIWENLIVNIFNDIASQKSKMFFSQYSWLNDAI